MAKLRPFRYPVELQIHGPVRHRVLPANGDCTFRGWRLVISVDRSIEAFGDVELEAEDYELAAEYFNAARKKGIQGSNTDFLICAISSRRKMPILTTDKDFTNFQSVFPVSLHVPRT